MENSILSLIALMGIPSAITGLCFWRIQKRIEKEERKRDEVEKARETNEFMLIKGVSAAIALGEATAKAVQRIPDTNCNGDMHEALEYAQKIKHEQESFITRQGIEHLHFDFF